MASPENNIDRRKFLKAAGWFTVRTVAISAGFILGDSTLRLIRGPQGKSEPEVKEEAKNIV